MSGKKKIYDFIKTNAIAEIQAAKKEFEQAKNRINSEYFDFLVLLPQNVRLTKQVFELDQDARNIGIWVSDERGTYVTINKPYITVDGRIKMARDEHREANKMLHIHPPQIFEVAGRTLMSVQIDSELYGQTTGTIEVGIEKSSGIDANNPFANAQTSAIGRALGFLGYGLVGTGAVASADEMQSLSDKEEPPQGTSTGQSEPSGDNNNQPKNFRVQVQELPKWNTDGSSYFKVLTESKKTVNIIFPKGHKKFVEPLGNGQILTVNGWLKQNNGNVTLRVNHQVEPIIEVSAA